MAYYPKTKTMPDGGLGYHVGNGAYIGKANYHWDPKFGGFMRYLRGDKEPPTAPVPASPQHQTPENPGIRREAFSTYGVTIPISTGRRAVAGNIVDASDLVPRMIGGQTIVREYVVPVTIPWVTVES